MQQRPLASVQRSLHPSYDADTGSISDMVAPINGVNNALLNKALLAKSMSKKPSKYHADSVSTNIHGKTL